jgi:hypothetical protein
MAVSSILTSYSKVISIEETYQAPVVVIPNTRIPLTSLYCFIGRVDQWDNDNSPEQPLQTQAYLKQVFKNMFAAKQITSSDLSPVLQRIDWTYNTTYYYYQDNFDMLQVDDNGFLKYPFYVKNQYDQVFKCLWNNNGGPSLYEPYFEPGTYGTNNIYNNPLDGYKWKYMYTIDSGSKLKFMDDSWIPVPLGANSPNPLISTAGYGDIEAINITNGGSGYDSVNSVVTIAITGDGYGATATPVISGGQITDITVTNPGSNYTFANVSISSTLGSGATAISPVSPVGGHSFDPISELGTSRIMFDIEFDKDETGTIPTDVKYHQVGILVNPTTNGLSPLPANGSIYDTSTQLILAPGFGSYQYDEIVYQGSPTNPTFVGTVVSFDLATSRLRVINTTGTLITNASLYGSVSTTTRTLLGYNTPEFTLFSGLIVYLENRSAIQRSTEGIEQFKFVLSY